MYRPFPAALKAQRSLLMRVAALGVIAIALGGCYHTKERVAQPEPVDYRQRHPITIQEGPRTLEVFVGHARGGLMPVQRADVMAFAANWRREATGGIIVDVPQGTSNARAAQVTMREIRSILSAAGVPARGIEVRPYRPDSPAQLASIRLNYPKLTAQVGPCGLWPEDLGPTTSPIYNENRPYHNLGCAYQRNMAAMVENPSDLVQPRSEAPSYTGRRATVFDKYRKGESTATQYPDNSQAKISEVGK